MSGPTRSGPVAAWSSIDRRLDVRSARRDELTPGQKAAIPRAPAFARQQQPDARRRTSRSTHPVTAAVIPHTSSALLLSPIQADVHEFNCRTLLGTTSERRARPLPTFASRGRSECAVSEGDGAPGMRERWYGSGLCPLCDWEEAPMTVSPVLDAAGRRRLPATMPGYHAGRPPRNKGRLYPADPPTVEEIIAVMRRPPTTDMASGCAR